MARSKRPAVRINWGQREDLEASKKPKPDDTKPKPGAGIAAIGIPGLPALEDLPPSKHVSVKQWKKLQEKWHTSLGQAIEWKKTKGKWPKVNRKGDREEQRLYDFLYRSTPGENGWTKDRWAKLNAAFGEGWEMDCFPCLGTGGLLEKGHQRNPRDEIKWDATLADLVRFEKDNGRFPKDKGGESERKLYYWLYNTSDTSGTMYSKERAAKLDAAFGDRWQSRAFPKSFYYW